uniref:Proline-serine-threonine phosphatase interacting protein 2 n=1 Tax=Athene cunicularia TaxID=194338 RepID=A0A663NCE7_ATHCN
MSEETGRSSSKRGYIERIGGFLVFDFVKLELTAKLLGGDSTDLTSTVGYDSIIQHLNDSRKNCKEFEDFLKERAIIEEKYGKELINLSKKKPCGQTEGSLDLSQSVPLPFLSYTVHPGALMVSDVLTLDLLSPQIELIMEAIHKNRNLQYKKTMEAKRLYEQRCRDKDEAEQAVHRNANLVTQKQFLFNEYRSYQQNVTTLEKIREEWQKEHIKACEFFETQECERINYFRNALWLHVNQLSQDCVQNDEKYEEIRKSLEMCSIEKDIDFFVSLRKTGSLAPAPVVYENYYNTQRNATPVRRTLTYTIAIADDALPQNSHNLLLSVYGRLVLGVLEENISHAM